jgi:uncharacterized protein (TIGR00369 family)
METQRLVLPGHLNHFGFLFGGTLLAWVDEASWIAASLDFPLSQFVTVGMGRVEFHHPVRQGAILTIRCEKEKEGSTSVTYQVRVYDYRNRPDVPIFSTSVTLVSVDDLGKKRSLRA